MEEHSSSGLIVSTPAGSTGWLSSIFNMAYGATGLLGKDLKPKFPELKEAELLFAVREPFKNLSTQTGITERLLRGENKLVIESLMFTNGGDL